MLPEIRHTEDPVRAGKGAFQALEIVHVRRDNFGAMGRKSFSLLVVRVACNRAARELAGVVVENGAAQPAALRSCGSHHRDDFRSRHVVILSARVYPSNTKADFHARRERCQLAESPSWAFRRDLWMRQLGSSITVYSSDPNAAIDEAAIAPLIPNRSPSELR